MKELSIKRMLAGILAIIITLSLAACASEPEPVEPGPEPEVVEAVPDPSVFINLLDIPRSASTVGVVKSGLRKYARDRHELNSDTVGWLSLPGSEYFDEPVMFYPVATNAPQSEKFYYLRRDFNKVPNKGPLASQYGSYFADFRCTFDGGWQGMSRNTTVYGHSMEDDPNGKAFSQLKKFLDPDFARETPYIYFSLVDEDLAWEVFAVFYATVNLPYNLPNQSDEEFLDMISEVKARSIYDYGVEITTEDKLLTLSTCCYNFTAAYPNNYRFVIMARLVPEGYYTLEEATFTLVDNPKSP